MPADEENAKYLYLVLTAAGPSSIDWAAVAKDLDLKPGATSKRWSRLKQAMNENKPPGPTAYQFLWLCIKHCKEGKAPDWKFIAEKCDTTVGAASKRYSRLKIAMEKGEAMPTVNVPAKDKGKPKTDAGDGKEYEAPAADGQAKRKRAPPKKGMVFLIMLFPMSESPRSPLGRHSLILTNDRTTCQ
ncbi:hypothetical protein BCR34DRAFT_472521 [Clohesyomyces aquaticus]|uniref:Myb-like DNA-binding domain-containing protein n=1 Tax=Clohesyomyces aquaticus TaxID=1231657 RepID=A0A1Y2A914_9PLEO|nr:hypothetical protein BCR34DRAFT_472521 [Clohesyomyces aquaticus]